MRTHRRRTDGTLAESVQLSGYHLRRGLSAESSISASSSKLYRAATGKKSISYFGMVNDKDISGVLKVYRKMHTYYFTKASVKRALQMNY